jgi:hypothetical protein
MASYRRLWPATWYLEPRGHEACPGVTYGQVLFTARNLLGEWKISIRWLIEAVAPHRVSVLFSNGLRRVQIRSPPPGRWKVLPPIIQKRGSRRW